MFIKVRAQTGQRKEQVEQLAADLFAIHVREEPQHNMANTRIIELLARELMVPAKKIRFVSGQRSPSKLFEIK